MKKKKEPWRKDSLFHSTPQKRYPFIFNILECHSSQKYQEQLNSFRNDAQKRKNPIHTTPRLCAFISQQWLKIKILKSTLLILFSSCIRPCSVFHFLLFIQSQNVFFYYQLSTCFELFVLGGSKVQQLHFVIRKNSLTFNITNIL